MVSIKGGNIAQERYDVIVAGAGVGGMATTALLVNSGYKTLLVEKLPFLGGRASSFNYKGYTICTGASYIEMGGGLEKIFREVGAKFDLTPWPLQRIRIRGKDHTLPEKGQLKLMLSLAARNQAEADRVWNAIKRGLSWKEPSLEITFEEWLCQYTDNEVILGIFRGPLAARLGADPRDMPAGYFFGFLHVMGSLSGSGFPPGGNITIWEELAKAIRAKGGTIWTEARVERILVEDEVVRGVVVRKGSEDITIFAKAVVSNVGPKMTVKLAGEENFEKGYLKEVRNLQEVPFYVLAVTSDMPLYEYPGGFALTESRRVSLVACPTNVDPGHAPPGKHMIWAYSTPPAPCYDKEKELDLMLQDIRDNLPDYDKYGQVLMGQCFLGEWPGYRSTVGRDMSQKTPVENLYNVGDATRPWGWCGVRGCVISAQVAVDDIKVRLK